jgi:hypothetical protein
MVYINKGKGPGNLFLELYRKLALFKLIPRVHQHPELLKLPITTGCEGVRPGSNYLII